MKKQQRGEISKRLGVKSEFMLHLQYETQTVLPDLLTFFTL